MTLRVYPNPATFFDPQKLNQHPFHRHNEFQYSTTFAATTTRPVKVQTKFHPIHHHLVSQNCAKYMPLKIKEPLHLDYRR
jgi:hypothetical protein